MNKDRTGMALIVMLIAIILILMIMSLIAKFMFLVAFGPILRNIIPLLIGGFVGYWIRGKKR